MMKIAVVDDDAKFLDVFAETLKGCLGETTQYRLASFADAAQFLRAHAEAEGDPFDIVFLDILLPGKSGLDLAREIYLRDRACLVVYVTVSPDYAVQGYGMNAVGYLLKPLDEARLRAVLDACEARRREAAAGMRALWLKIGREVRRVDVPAILYLESDDKRVHIHCDEETVLWHGKLRDLMDGLPASFLRVHQSYAVNLDRVVRLCGDRVVLENGEVVPISYRYRREVAERFFRAVRGEI